jgi:hypothetical protein
MRSYFIASALTAASALHATTHCTAELGCVGADPAWVQKFSVAAAGPEQYVGLTRSHWRTTKHLPQPLS